MKIIYCFMDPDSSVIRYVGKTSRGLKRRDEHLKFARKRNPKFRVQRWIANLLAEGRQPKFLVLDSASTDDELSRLEIQWIAHFREQGCDLTNLSDGGDGNRGYRHSLETKKKLAEIARNLSPEIRIKQADAQRALPFSEKRSRSVSVALKGREFSSEHRANISRGKKGKKSKRVYVKGIATPQDRKEKLSIALKAYWAAKRGS